MAEVRPYNDGLTPYEVSEQDKLDRTVTLDVDLAGVEQTVTDQERAIGALQAGQSALADGYTGVQSKVAAVQSDVSALATAQATDEQKITTLDAAQVNHLSDYMAHASGTFLRAHVDNGARHIPSGSIAVPKPPTTGRYMLVAKDGVLTWSPFEGSPLEPITGAWWGIYPKQATGQSLLDAVAQREAWAGRKFDSLRHYSDASTGGNGPFGDDDLVQLIGQGYRVFESMASRLYSGADFSWTQAANGELDYALHLAGQRIKAIGKPLWFGLDIEFDGGAHSTEVPADFIRYWQRAYNIIVGEEGATNAAWVWCCTGYSGNWPELPALYPGDAFVDYIAYDPYRTHLPIPTTPEIDTYGFYNWIEQQTWHGPKPYMLAEYGCIQDPNDPMARSGWLERVPAALKVKPKIKGVFYFDSRDAYVLTDAASQAGFAKAGADPYVNPGS